MRTETLLLAATAAATLLGGARAQDKNVDKIFLTDGSVVRDVGIVTEGLKDVEYRSGRNKSTVASERVLRIEYGAKPKGVDLGDTAAEGEEYIDAIAELQTYLGEIENKPERKFPWAPAYAQYRLVELFGVVGDINGLVDAADAVIKHHADSRYAPLAFVAKAQALLDRDDKAAAKGVATQFGSFLQDKGLGGRWEQEQRFWAAVTSGETGKKLQDALAAVSSASAEYPSVNAQAEVAIAESLFNGGKPDEAEKIFRSVSNAAQATNRTMAAAWTGLGDCLYAKADKASGDDKGKLLREAATAYMRPVVMYPNQGVYVSRALFYAGRSFQLLADEESRDRARRLYREVIFKYPGTRWEREAREAFRSL